MTNDGRTHGLLKAAYCFSGLYSSVLYLLFSHQKQMVWEIQDLDADLFHNIFWTACIQESIRNPVTAIYAVYVSAEY